MNSVGKRQSFCQPQLGSLWTGTGRSEARKGSGIWLGWQPADRSPFTVTAAKWCCQHTEPPRGMSGRHELSLSVPKLHAFMGEKKWLDTTSFCKYWYVFWPWDDFVRKTHHCTSSSWWWVPTLLPGGGSGVGIIRAASHCKRQSTASLWAFLKQKLADLECVSADHFVRQCLQISCDACTDTSQLDCRRSSIATKFIHAKK